MNFSSIFEKKPDSIKEKKELFGEVSARENNEKDLKSKQFFHTISASFVRYITRSLTDSIGRVSHEIKPLSIPGSKNMKSREDFKMIPVEEGGPTQEQIYASAIELAKKLGWRKIEQDKKSIITPYNESKNTNTQEVSELVRERIKSDLQLFGVSGEEVDTLGLAQSLDVLRQKDLEQKIKNPETKKSFLPEEIDKDFSLLQKLWDESYEDMDNTSDTKRTLEILDVTAKTDSSELLENYLKEQAHTLTPEEKFFIEISIQVKKFREKAREVISDGTEELISDKDFELFTDTNQVSDSLLEAIVSSIKDNKPLSERQIAIYAYHADNIELRLKDSLLQKKSPENNLEKFHIEQIEKMDIGPLQKANILLVYVGEKPATELELYRWNEKPESIISKIENLKLFCKEKATENKEITKAYFIATSEEVVDLLSKTDPSRDHEQYGRLMGYPETAIQSYIKNNATTEDLPEWIKRNPLISALSKDNYLTEFKVFENWMNRIKEKSPAIYNELVDLQKVD